jgi:hypothetical protein
VTARRPAAIPAAGEALGKALLTMSAHFAGLGSGANRDVDA